MDVFYKPAVLYAVVSELQDKEPTKKTEQTDNGADGAQENVALVAKQINKTVHPLHKW